jgi:hypothetical protein
MTLHCHKVDDRTDRWDGDQGVPVPPGWQIADGNVDDLRVCAVHPWQCYALIFADGDSSGTSMCRDASIIGECVATVVETRARINFFV